ncbi:Sodium-independent sulfate anion transporter-like protein, partial [Daphnia magna]
RRGLHRRHRRPAPGHRLCHRFGRQARARPVHRHHCRLPDLGPGRLQRADRRAGRRLHRRDLRHRATLRPGQSAGRHHVGWLLADRARRPAAGRLGALHPGEHRDRLHQRHCRADRPVPAERLPGPAHCPHAGRFLQPAAADRPAHRRHPLGRALAGRRLRGRGQPLAQDLCHGPREPQHPRTAAALDVAAARHRDRLGRCHRAVLRLAAAAGNHRQPLRRHSPDLAQLRLAR